MELIRPNTNFDFIGKRRAFAAVSVALIVLSFVLLALKGGPRYGVDFEGGTIVQLKFDRPAPLAQIREALSALDLGDYSLQEYGSPEEALVRVRKAEDETGGETRAQLVEGALRKAFAQSFTVERVETVGPKVGGDLRQKALLAILYSLVGLLIYITLRFEFRFGVAAIMALAHDTIITIGAFSLLDKEMTLTVVAAILTLIGFSLNDTIVVFDRIRENLRLKRGMALTDLINLSVNQTLSRTILTSGTVFLVVVALFFIGGEVIHDFAFAMLVGVVVGTYSSVFIASPILILWDEYANNRRANPARR
ncbi:MAG: protein translocase subunit SecF [Nitrospinae bacterium]|nr:protein translocase subunit SecF [Nitrospinota bacterium]